MQSIANQGVDLQVVHGPGATYVRHPNRGCPIDILLTGGDDYLVRALPASANDESFKAVTLEDATAQITWIDVGSFFIVTGSEDGCVRVYHIELGTGELGGTWNMSMLLTRTTLAVRCAATELAHDRSIGPRIAVASDELVVKVISLEEPEDDVQLLVGHTRSVAHCAWSPTAPILLTAGCDGTVRVWDMRREAAADGEGPRCAQVIKDVLPSARPGDTSERAIQALWHPSGRFFVVPSKTNELLIFAPSADDPLHFERKSAFSARSPSIDPPAGAVTALEFSPNGRYLASATAGNGQVTVWDTAARMPIARRLSEANVTSISWHHRRNALAWADLGGQLYRWENVIDPAKPQPGELLPGQANSWDWHPSVPREWPYPDWYVGTAAAEAAAAEAGGVDGGHDGAGRMLDLDAGADGDALDDEMDEFDDAEDDLGADLDGFLVDDDGGDYARDLQREKRAHRGRAGRGGRGMMNGGNFVPITPAQPAFQVTSTPMRNQRRYLAFNTIGTLVAVDQDTHQSVLFESYDTAARRNYRIQDHHKYSMASLAPQGALFACDASPHAPSTLFFKPFDNMWGAYSTEWTFELPQGETATCVAMGGPNNARSREGEEENVSYAASTAALVATSAGYVRVFSASGLQRYIWHVGADIVTIVAGSHTAMLVTRASPALAGRQNLQYTLVDMQTLATVNAGALPLQKDTTLQWAGFTEHDTPAVFDSRGVLSFLDGARSGPSAKWVPALDVRHMPELSAGADLNYWPVGVASNKLLVVMLKGAAVTMPDASAARPLVQELELALPVLEAPTAKQEEAWLRQSLLASMIRGRPPALLDVEQDAESVEQGADKALLQLIQLSCKSDKHKKAIDAARELHSARTLDAALKIAQYFNLASLVDRMEGLREFVETRKERIDEAGGFQAGNNIIIASGSAAGAGGAAGRILVPESQESFHAAAARRALAGDDWAPSSHVKPSKRTLGGGIGLGSGGFAFSGATGTGSTSLRAPASSAITATTVSAAMPSEKPRMTLEEEIEMEERMLRESERRSAESALGEGDDEEASRPHKRKSIGETDMPAPAKKSGNPFAKSKPANPFAKTSGTSQRERSMHKSNSFFDRVDAVEGTGPTSAAAAAAGAKSAKQSKLFAFAAQGNKKSSSKAKSAASTSLSKAAVPAATPAFADTQMVDEAEALEEARLSASSSPAKSQRGGREDASAGAGAGEGEAEAAGADEESLRLTLHAARRAEQESVALEETQMLAHGGANGESMLEDDDETQRAEAHAAKKPQPQSQSQSQSQSQREADADKQLEADEEDESQSARSKLAAFMAPTAVA